MRRRRPSAVYAVLDEEQLLGGVDLTDHPDPLAGRPAAAARDERDEWSADPDDDPYEDVSDAWRPHDVDVASLAAPGGADAGGGGRRRWLILGFAGVLLLVLLVSRQLGAALDAGGSRPAGRPATASPTADPRPPVVRSSGGEAPAQVVSRLPLSPARRSSGGLLPTRQHAPPRVGRRILRGATRRVPSRPSPAPVRLAAGRAATRVRGRVRPSRSPAQEFGFER